MKKVLQLIRPFRETRNIVALCLAMFLCAGSLWAQTTINWSAADQGYTNAQVIESVGFDDNVTGTFYKGTNNNEPKYYSTGSAIRCYGGNYFTISTSVGNLTGIVITFASGEGSNAITTDVGDYNNGTWTGEAQSVTFTIGGTSGHRRLAAFSITYTTSAPSVAMPTFNPASGTTFGDEGLTVTISQANSKPVYYTLDGTVPTVNSTLYSAPITLTSTTTIKAVAYDGSNASSVATATYTYIDPNTPGTENNPYTVAQARAAIDDNTGTQGVYATGIVSAIPTAYNTQYSNITFNFVDNAGDEVFLQAYRCGGAEAADVAVGDIVVVYGNLTKYNSTYEFAQGCQLVSLTHPTGYVEAPTFSPAAGTFTEPQTVTLSCATEGATIYYTLDGSEPDDESTPYTNPITISTTTTINAIAYLNGNASNVATATYTFVSLANISDITEVDTAYMVQGTVVATNSRGFIMGDGTGYVYYYNNGAVSQSVGDMVTVSGTTGTYGQIIQFTNTATVTVATSSNYDGTPVATLITEVPDYSQGYHLSTYLEYEGELTKNNNNYLITVGESQIQISYPTTAQANELTALNNKTVHVKGYFSGINSSSRFTTMLESVEEVVSTEPSITVAPATINAIAEGTDGYLAVAYENIPDLISFDIQFCDANGDELVGDDPDWIYAEINEPTETEGYTVFYIINTNDGDARTAYFKVCSDDVCSDIVTVNQAAYVAPTVATLPFEFNGVRADIEDVDGLTQEGLGTDYAISTNPTTQLKFDGTGDWLLLHFDREPGKLSFDIKGNGFSGGTFTVQTSEDGVTYTELASYTELGAAQTVEFYTLGTNVRYIKWIYTEKGSGNVGLGNISLAQPSTEPVITLAPVEVEVSAEATTGTLSMSYVNMGEDPLFTVQFFAEDGETYASYNWISASVNDEMNVSYSIEANDGEARTAYLKVYGLTDEYEEAYSNLVTITQAAAPQQYELTISEFENLEIFTFVGDFNEPALEGAGTIPVSEGASVSLSVSANEGYVLSSLVVDGHSVLSQLDETGLYTFVMPSHAVTVTATAELDIPGEWVLTSIEDLTENDVFVIVGTKSDGNSYAMSNDNGTGAAPAAVSVTVVDNTLSGTVPSNIQWNISFSDEGFTFYPNGNTDTWLYSTNVNNGVRVGDNNANVFTIDPESGYIVHVATSRYLGVYQAQDWRTYTTIHANIANETFAFYKKVTSNNTQTIDMATGTNWVSFYVETNLDDLKAALVAATPNSAITIQDQNNNTKYNPSNHRWTGRLTTMDVAYMYKITVASGCEITLEGMPINPADHPVTINLGATWIAFPLSESMTLANAFAGFAVAGDKVQSQNNNASYNGTRWSGRLTTLEPGKGYVYQSAQAGSRTLTFPSASKRKMK